MSFPNGDFSAASNQGIRDGRPEGQNPDPTPSDRTFDTFTDPDASARTSVGDTLGGATSKDLHRGLGVPAGGEVSQELHHDGSHGRKKQTFGLDKQANPGQKESVLGREERDTQKYGSIPSDN